MATMTMNDYKESADLLGAYERFEKTTKQWKSRWWAVVEEIYTKSAFWMKHFILDPIAHTIKRITRGRLPRQNEEKRLTYKCEAEGTGAYIVQHFDENGKHLWIKCGKADDVKKRLAQHFDSDYKGVAKSGVVLGWFPCKNSNHALAMEDVIRDYFESKAQVMGHDRFPGLTELTENDFVILNKKAEMLAQIFGA